MIPNEALDIYELVAAAYPAWRGEERTAVIWADMLADLDYETTVQAAKQIIATDDGWPSIAKLRREAARITHALAPYPDEAWLEVTDAARRLGTYHGPPDSWSHRAITATVASLGWQRICTDERPEILRVQFLRTYESVADRDEQRALAGEQMPAISPAMRDVLGGAADSMALPGGDTDG